MWYYLEEGQQRGPVEEAVLAALHRDGKINSETLVWREGMANWQPLREANPNLGPAASAPAAQPSAAAPGVLGQVACSQCGGMFPASEVIRYGNTVVCAACKPIFMQKLKEGANVAGGGTTSGWVSEEQVRERDYDHDIGDYMSKAWALFTSDAGSLIAATVLVGLCLFVANIIPYLSFVLAIVFTGPLMGGLYTFYLKKTRSEPSTVGDAFSGFGPRFGQLLLGKFIPNLLAGLALVPAVVIGVFVVIAISAAARNGGGAGGSGMGAGLIIAGVLMLAGFIVTLYFQICWVFTLWLVADKNMSFWPAMSLSRAVVRKHWWQNLWLGIVTFFLFLLGLVLCLVGGLVTGPLALAMWANAFERLFGDLQPE